MTTHEIHEPTLYHVRTFDLAVLIHRVRFKNKGMRWLPSICSKLTQHIVHSSVSRFLEENNILTPRKHGFRSHHSCEVRLIPAIDDWTKALDSRTCIDLSTFDFSKAFDSVPHRRLLAKIESYAKEGATGLGRFFPTDASVLLLTAPSHHGPQWSSEYHNELS